MTTINDHDRRQALATIDWFSEAAFNKMAAGSLEHGGVLRTKGGLLAEAEAECLDLVIYVRAVRAQLEAIHANLADHPQEAASALRLLLYGDTTDVLPAVVIRP